MITLNGTPTDAAGLTVADLLAKLDLPDRGVAVAVDAAIVPKSEWPSHVVEDGAHVEVVTAVQGG